MTTRLNFVCVDNSHFSENGFDWYLENYHKATDAIGIVQVIRLPILPFVGLDTGLMSLKDQYELHFKLCSEEAISVQKKFEKICKEKDLKCEYFNANPKNSTGHVICELAQENKADLIVVGQRGLGTVSRTLLGSTSDFILHHSKIPVMVVPPDSSK